MVWRTKAERFRVLSRDSFTCQFCGRKSPEIVLECGHIRPMTSGGGEYFDNLIAVCRECNQGRIGISLDESEVDSILNRRKATSDEKWFSENWKEIYALEGRICDSINDLLQIEGCSNLDILASASLLYFMIVLERIHIDRNGGNFLHGKPRDRLAMKYRRIIFKEIRSLSENQLAD